MTSFITAVVVAHDSAHVLPDCLDALSRAAVPTIVVDNASKDNSVEVAEAYGAAVIRNNRNQGYGRANNIGVRAAESEFVLIVNPDVILEPGAVAELLGAARRYPEASLFAPRLVEPDGRIFFQARSLLSPYLKNPSGRLVLPEGDACAPFFSGACLLIKRDLYLRLGGFDENIFLFYEDDDLCRRVADSTPALIYVHEAIARHARGQSSTPKPGRVFKSRWHQAWSRAYVSRKYHLPNPAPRMFAVNAVKALGACLVLNRRLIERYGGSAAGAWAFLTRQTALAKERLLAEDAP